MGYIYIFFLLLLSYSVFVAEIAWNKPENQREGIQNKLEIKVILNRTKQNWSQLNQINEKKTCETKLNLYIFLSSE